MLLRWFERLGRKRVIKADGEDYLIRYYPLFKTSKENEVKRFNLFIHNFKRSDLPVLHDHPWPWFSLVLKGGYWEHTPIEGSTTLTKKKWRGPGSICFRKATDFHFVELKPGLDTWTLFGHGKRIRKWGFLVNGQWIYWKEYEYNEKQGRPKPPSMTVVEKGGF